YNRRYLYLNTLHGLGFRDDADLARPLSTFSGGELTRASLGRALAGDPDLLLLDEPTNHLDIESLEWLEAHLIALDAAIVLVAHDRWFLEAVGTSVLELEAGRSRFFAGSWHTWRRERAARELALGRAIERQQAEIDRLERFVTRFRAGTRARQAQSRAKKLARMERLSTAPRDGAALEFAFKPPSRSGRVIFELQHASLAAGEKELLHDTELWLERGEHVSLVGANGAGKTTLIETLAGRRELPAGKLLVGHNVKVGFLSQHADELSTGTARTVVEVAQHATRLTPGKARALLGRFLFTGEDADKPLEALSGGERRRLSLAILMNGDPEPPNVLILDEPTNHLDLESREALESALRDFPGSVLLVSHDRALLDAIGTRTIALEDRALHSYVGGWPEYLRVREQRERAGRSQAAPSTGSKSGPGRPTTAGKRNPPTGAKPAAERRKRTPPARVPAAERALEAEIEAAEATLATVEDELSDPASWATPEASARSTARHDEARRAVEELYERLEAVAG
ncbi:MAG: ABC-F family ATP-binding cassette domain-containing protein, partial [Solirubrobacteraceae bacterium]